MNFNRFIYGSAAASLRPPLACEIAPAGVVAAWQRAGTQEMLSAFVPLPRGIFSAGIKAPNFSNQSAVSSALRQALDQVSQRETKLTVVIPDSAVRVLVLDFDSLPSKQVDTLPIIRFRLRKLVPFEVEDATVSYQVMPGRDGTVRTIVAVSPGAVIAEYENAVREAGYEPGVVLPSTLAALAAVDTDEPALVVNRNATSVTTAITRQNELLLHRTLDLTGPKDDPGTQEQFLPEENWGHAVEELQQSVSVAIAYFEDTLAAPPRQLLSCGLGGAEDLAHLLSDTRIPVRDLAPTPTTGNATSIPRGILAGVRGALAT